MALIVGAMVVLAFGLGRALLAARSEPENEIGPFEEDSPDLVITLVHGTWAPDAEWARPESLLCKRLSKIMRPRAYQNDPPYSVRFYGFRWSGRNSFSARRRAAKALIRVLHRLTARYPRSRHFVIAHSHGGNVALLALKPALAARISGLVCLATPVIVSRERAFEAAFHMILPWAPFSPLVLVLAYDLPQPLSIYALSTSGLLFLGFLVWPKIAPFFPSSPDEVRARYPDPEKVLFLRSPGDEAARALGAAGMVSWLVTQLLLIPNRLVVALVRYSEVGTKILYGRETLVSATIASWLISWLLLLWWLTARASVGESPTVISEMLIPAAELMVFLPVFLFGFLWGTRVAQLCFLFLYVPLIMFPMGAIAVLAGLTLGPEMAFLALVREISAEPCPFGSWRVAMVREPGWTTFLGGRLQHSSVHQSDEAHILLINWIHQQIHGTSCDRRAGEHALFIDWLEGERKLGESHSA